jgi:hypothetical protein
MPIDTALVALLLLGGLHGVNPAMGWLFAVSLGLQEQRRGAVWAALAPLALGHALAIGAALLLAALLGLVLPLDRLRWVAAAALVAAGVFQLVRHAHPRYGGMRVGARDLTIWSFLMASAHGAGLMAVPFVIGAGGGAGEGVAGGGHGAHVHGAHVHGGAAGGAAGDAALAAVAGIDMSGVIAVLAHTIGYLAVTGILAVLVYEKLGLRLLRTAWINLNLIWAAALIVTGVLTLLL